MRRVDETEFHSWLAERHLQLEKDCSIGMSAGSAYAISTDFSDRATLKEADALVRFLAAQTDCDFLTWVTHWHSTDDPYSHQLLSDVLQTRESELGPKPRFISEGDPNRARCVLLLSLLTGWDCYLIPSHGEYVIRAHHDDMVFIILRKPQTRSSQEMLKDIRRRWRIDEVPISDIP